MRPTSKLVLVLVLALLFGSAPSWAAPEKTRTVRVLFIGNSLVYFNDLPAMFADFAEATWPDLDVVADSVTESGESLKGHWEKETALKKLQEGRWDYVVLQDHGALALGSFQLDGVTRREYPEQFFEYGERFARAVLAARAKPVFYQTYVSRPENLSYIDHAYTTLGRKTGAPVAPVARAWYRLLNSKDFGLYHQDQMHPSVHGSYLVAASLAATIFGDLPEKQSVHHPAAVADRAAREILAAVRAVRAELASTGGYPEVPAPDYATRPRLESSLALNDPALSGTWYAVDNALQLSLGSRLTLSFEEGRPRIELIDYTLNAAFALPINDLEVAGNVIRFTTKSQNRNYRVQLARREAGPEMLVEYLGQSSVYTHVAYRRDADLRFALLEKQYTEIAGQSTQESFETALLRHYETLTGGLGADVLSSRLMGQTPTSDPWWSIMTGQEYTSRQQHDAAIRFLTFATHRFPQSPEACHNLSKGLEAAGRLQEAYEAIVKAESLITKEHHPTLLATIQEDKARLLKRVVRRQPQSLLDRLHRLLSPIQMGQSLGAD